jgi:hypothetical protein
MRELNQQFMPRSRESFSTKSAQTVSSIFLLRALVAWEMLHERKIQCRSAARRPAIHAYRSKNQRSNSQVADTAVPKFTENTLRKVPELVRQHGNKSVLSFAFGERSANWQSKILEQVHTLGGCKLGFGTSW